MYVRALARCENALGLKHTSTLFTVNNLRILYQDQGKLKEVKDMYVRKLAGCEKVLKPKHINTATV